MLSHVNPAAIASNILIEKGGVLDNYGCVSLKGYIYVLGTINNYGDIVLVPGILNIDGKFSNLSGGEVVYAGHLYVCIVTEAVVPINPDHQNPTKTEERRQLKEPYPSVVNKGETADITNNGVVAKAEVKVLSNGVLGNLTQKENNDI